MVSKSKLYAQLDSLEQELEERLIPHLEKASKGKNNLVFCVSDFNPFQKLKSLTDSETEDLVGLGSQILTLKNKLGESSEGSIAERICWYCREWGNTGNHHRSSAQGLATQFLEEIKNSRNNA